MSALRGPRRESGAATVDFVLVLVLLMPLFLGVLQLALVLHVRNTAAAAAAEGARRAAVQGAGPQAGIARAEDQLSGAVSERFVTDATVETVHLEGMPAYRLRMDLSVPALGLGGPALTFQVSGTAVLEPPAAGATGQQ